MLKERTSLSRSTLYYYVAQEASSPRQRRLGPRRVAWLATWLASEVRARTLNRPTNRRGHPNLNAATTWRLFHLRCRAPATHQLPVCVPMAYPMSNVRVQIHGASV